MRTIKQLSQKSRATRPRDTVHSGAKPIVQRRIDPGPERGVRDNPVYAHEAANMAQRVESSLVAPSAPAPPVQMEASQVPGGANPANAAPMTAKGDASTATNKTGLTDAIKASMEERFNADFSDIRVHKNSSMAPKLGALAFTRGSEVHFAPGEFRPYSISGRKIIKHELGHVLQQRRGIVNPTTHIAGLPVNDTQTLEDAADRYGESFTSANQLKSEETFSCLSPYAAAQKRNTGNPLTDFSSLSPNPSNRTGAFAQRNMQALVNYRSQCNIDEVDDKKTTPEMGTVKAQTDSVVQGMFTRDIMKTMAKIGTLAITSPLWLPPVRGQDRDWPVRSGPSTMTNNIFDAPFHVVGIRTRRTRALSDQVVDSITNAEGEFDNRRTHVAGHSEGGMNAVLATDPTFLAERILRKRNDPDQRIDDIMDAVTGPDMGGLKSEDLEKKQAALREQIEKAVHVTTMGSPYVPGQSQRKNVEALSTDQDPVTNISRRAGFPYTIVGTGGHSFELNYKDVTHEKLGENDQVILSGGMFTSHTVNEERVDDLKRYRTYRGI